MALKPVDGGILQYDSVRLLVENMGNGDGCDVVIEYYRCGVLTHAELLVNNKWGIPLDICFKGNFQTESLTHYRPQFKG